MLPRNDEPHELQQSDIVRYGKWLRRSYKLKSKREKKITDWQPEDE